MNLTIKDCSKGVDIECENLRGSCYAAPSEQRPLPSGQRYNDIVKFSIRLFDPPNIALSYRYAAPKKQRPLNKVQRYADQRSATDVPRGHRYSSLMELALMQRDAYALLLELGSYFGVQVSHSLKRSDHWYSCEIPLSSILSKVKYTSRFLSSEHMGLQAAAKEVYGGSAMHRTLMSRKDAKLLLWVGRGQLAFVYFDYQYKDSLHSSLVKDNLSKVEFVVMHSSKFISQEEADHLSLQKSLAKRLNSGHAGQSPAADVPSGHRIVCTSCLSKLNTNISSLLGLLTLKECTKLFFDDDMRIRNFARQNVVPSGQRPMNFVHRNAAPLEQRTMLARLTS